MEQELIKQAKIWLEKGNPKARLNTYKDRKEAYNIIRLMYKSVTEKKEEKK
jgi:hypothetical protein